MKRINIVGVGLGEGTITGEARQAIAQADVLLGAPRLLNLFKGFHGPSYPCYLPQEVSAIVAKEEAAEFAVLVSGDVGFYSAAIGLTTALAAYQVRLVPGISTVAAFFARLKLPWQEAVFVSTHGRDLDIVATVRRNRLTFCLTGNKVNEIGAMLGDAGFKKIRAFVGEKLGMKDERVYETQLEALAQGEFPSLSVVLLENEAFDDSTPAGLPDNCFIRSARIPLTKSETRAVVLSKLNLRPNFVCWDLGAGTGSVTVEMALNAYDGHVYAVERRDEGLSLIKENCAAFKVGNVSLIGGEAPDVLEALPPPDAVFIGGSGGKVQAILAAVLAKNPRARIVLTAVTIETVAQAVSKLSALGLEPEIVQLNVARGRRSGDLHLMQAQNPITILSVGGDNL